MNKLIKWLLIGGAGLAVLIIVALIVIPLFVDLNRYKPVLEEKVSAATGRSFRIGSDLNLSLFPWAGVSFSDLELGNPEGFKEDSFVKINAFEVRVKLLPLLSKNIQVQKFIVTGPQVKLIKNRQGLVNWEFVGTKSAPSPGETEKETPAEGPTGSQLPIEQLAVSTFTIQNGLIVYIDQAAGTRNEVGDFNLTLKDVSFDKPIQLSMSASVDQYPVALEGTIGPTGKNPGQGDLPLDLSLTALADLNLKLAGNVKDAAGSPQIDLAATLAPFSPKKMLERIERKDLIQTADPGALQNLSLKARIKGGPQAVSVSNGQLQLDQSKLRFTAKASQFDRPNLAFDLDLDQIDLDRYMPPETDSKQDAAASKPKAAPSGKTSGSQKIDYDPLRRMILDGRLKAGTLKVGKATLKNILLKVAAKNGVIRMDPFSLDAYQGNIAGSGIFNVQRSVPASNLQLKIKNLQVGPLLQEQMQKDILEGVTNAALDLEMVGDQPERIKQSLSGSGELRFNDGAIVGIDLAGMVRNAKAAFGLENPSGEKPRTDFSELVSPFTLNKGVFNTTRTSLKSPFLRVLAAGTADLVKERLDMRIEPKLVGTLKGQGDEKQRTGITVPVMVSGTFADPRFKPDLKAVAREQVEKEVLEHKEVKKLLKKKEVQPYEKQAKDLIKGLFGD